MPAVAAAAATLLFDLVGTALAQDTQSLARAAKNPLANVVNVQFIYDANLGVGAADKTQHELTFQPVIPFAVSDDWSIITRTIIPLFAQPGMAAGESWTNGRGGCSRPGRACRRGRTERRRRRGGSARPGRRDR